MLPNLILYPNHILEDRTVKVVEFGEAALGQLIKDMTEAMDVYGGIGIAANQIGDSRRVMLTVHDGEVHTFINPRVLKFDGPPLNLEEGCLSLPGVVVTLQCRRELVEVEAQDIEGKVFRYTGLALDALKLQHELDHLDGLTLFQRMSYAKRILLRKKYMKDSKRYNFPAQMEAFTKRMREQADAAATQPLQTEGLTAPESSDPTADSVTG